MCVCVFSLFPVGRCSWVGVAGFGWVVPLCLFGRPVFGAFWAVWWLWVLLAPPPCFFFCGGVCLFLPVPSLGWRTHWSAFSVVFQVAVGGWVLPGCVPVPWVGSVKYTFSSAPLPAGLGSGSAGWAAAPSGFVQLLSRWAGVVRVLSSTRCRF